MLKVFFTDYSYFFYKSLKFNETFAQHQSLILSLQEVKRAHRKYLHLKMRSIKNCKTEFFLSKWIKIIFWRRNNATVLFSLVISGCSKILKITRDYLLLVISSPHLFPFIHVIHTKFAINKLHEQLITLRNFPPWIYFNLSRTNSLNFWRRRCEIEKQRLSTWIIFLADRCVLCSIINWLELIFKKSKTFDISMEISRKRPYDRAMNGSQTKLIRNGSSNSNHLMKNSFKCTLSKPVIQLSGIFTIN